MGCFRVLNSETNEWVKIKGISTGKMFIACSLFGYIHQRIFLAKDWFRNIGKRF